MFTNIDSVLEAELVGDPPFGAFAQTHLLNLLLVNVESQYQILEIIFICLRPRTSSTGDKWATDDVNLTIDNLTATCHAIEDYTFGTATEKACPIGFVATLSHSHIGLCLFLTNICYLTLTTEL